MKMYPPYPVIHMLAREREDEIRKETEMLQSLPARQPLLSWRLAVLLRRAADRIDPAYLHHEELCAECVCAGALDRA